MYEDGELESMKETSEVLREDQYLEDVYGSNSRLSNDEWLTAMIQKAKWIFDSAELRKRILAEAGIDAKHM